jgi:hypothetical protein
MRPDALIFSKGRPAQLELLERSIRTYAPNIFRNVQVCVSGEHYFEGTVRTWLYDPRRSAAVCFLVDDDVFIAEAQHLVACPASYRLGDYDYPFSLDGCVYRTAEIRDLVHTFSFTNPTQLEAGMDARREAFRGTRAPCHFTEIYPCLVGIPHNRVSASSNMPTMGGTADELNARYLAGERISLDAIVRAVDPDGGAHQNIVYEWEPR